MEMQAIERMLHEGKITAADILQQTPCESADDITKMMLRHLPYGEVRRALSERIADPRIADFDVLRLVCTYYKYCEHAPTGANASTRSDPL